VIAEIVYLSLLLRLCPRRLLTLLLGYAMNLAKNPRIFPFLNQPGLIGPKTFAARAARSSGPAHI
jgi:hypothetical protein